ncbi:hypothetical protein A0H81_02804 [Grifola frondosa]|uniref:Uncharacterized protein n=1 Tax=Grifola frondosa TaxID=5627 RepID=A0A1C7MNJ8_GRIFR|nr:hypothetical protein A0H81_02804 [Grifola frondosa]
MARQQAQGRLVVTGSGQQCAHRWQRWRTAGNSVHTVSNSIAPASNPSAPRACDKHDPVNTWEIFASAVVLTFFRCSTAYEFAC